MFGKGKMLVAAVKQTTMATRQQPTLGNVLGFLLDILMDHLGQTSGAAKQQDAKMGQKVSSREQLFGEDQIFGNGN